MQFSSKAGGNKAIDDACARSTRLPHGVSSNHFLRLIEDHGQIGFWTLEFCIERMTTSVGLYRLFGVCPSIPLGWPDLVSMMHPDDRIAHSQMYQTIRSGHAINREFRIVRPDGSMRWLQNKAEVIVDAKGNPARAIGVMVDVSDQHAARQSVEEGWHRYEALVKSMAATEYGLAADGEFVYSTGWYELTGQTEDEAAECGCLNVVHPDDRDLARSRWLASLASGSLYAFEPRIKTKNGQYRRFLHRAAPVVNPDGTVREWTGAYIEIPEESLGSNHEDLDTTLLKASHIRAARALLDWTIDELAFRSKVSVSSVRRIEAHAGHTVRATILRSIRRTFLANGISFTSGPQAGDVSVRLTAT